MTATIDPFPGFNFLSDPIEVSREFQAEKLSIIGLEPAQFGDIVDPSFFIGIGIRAGAAAGISAEGNVNMLSRIIQHQPALLDEPLVVSGEIEAVDAVPRGRRITTNVVFENDHGEAVISAPRVSLKPDPEKSGKGGAGDRPPLVVEDVDELRITSTYTLTPEMVKGYSMEGNAIHYEMEAANRGGFRAPIIGGGMGVHYLMAEIWGERGLSAVSIDIYFRRPIFWDDTFAVGVTDNTAALVRDGKVLTEIAIREKQEN